MTTVKNNDKEVVPPLCFVIGPIGKDGEEIRKHADMLLNAVIKHVLQVEPFHYLVKRADEDTDPGMISDRMITDIVNAELVVADLTGLNPNAFYELGIRHAREKPTIHVARSGTVLPFDNFAHRAIFVDLNDWYSIEKARHQLGETARFIRQPDFKVSNPITQANASFRMRESADPRDQVIAELREDVGRIERELISMQAVSQSRGVDPTPGGKSIDRYVSSLRRDLLSANFSSEAEITEFLLHRFNSKFILDFNVFSGDGFARIDIVRGDGLNDAIELSLGSPKIRF